MTAEEIREKISKNFNVIEIVVEDDSQKHKRHKQNQPGKGHYKLFIVSDDFLEMNQVMRHRKIYETLDMNQIHSLSISALTLQEWKNKSK